MPPGGAYGQCFPGGGLQSGAQGFGGGFPPRSGTKVDVIEIDEKALLVKVNAYIRGMYEWCKNDRSEKAKKKAQQNPGKGSGKSTPAWDHAEHAFLGREEPKSDLELYLMRKNVSEEVPFNNLVRPSVEKQHPDFYEIYKTPQALRAAMNKYDDVWKW